MRRPNIQWPDWVDFRVVLAFVALLIGIALLIGALNTGSSDNKADDAKQKATQSQGTAKQAQAGTSILSRRLSRMGRCLLRKGLTSAQRAKCINLTLPLPQRGLPGLAGQQGRPGASGRQGLPGARGPRGPGGPKGDPGELGPQGDPCLASVDPACIGPAGDTGEKGTPGDTGPSGERGAKGDIGGTGPKGEQGTPGADSTVPGPRGPQGEAGPAGPAGATGATGPQGPTGPAPAAFSFTFVDGAGNQQTLTCTDPEGDLTYACG